MLCECGCYPDYEDRFVLYHWDGLENVELARVDSEGLAKDIIRACRPRAVFYSADIDWDI